MWPKWRQWLPNMGIVFTWPHGESNTRTQSLIHIVYIVLLTAWNLVTSGTLQFMKNSPRPLASRKSRKNTLNINFFNQHIASGTWWQAGRCNSWKMAPDPSHPKSQEKHSVWRSKSTFLINTSRVEPGLQVGRVWRPSDVTPLILMSEQKKWCLPLGRKSHERWMRPWNIMVVTCEWP